MAEEHPHRRRDDQDPSELTTEALKTEIAHLKELVMAMFEERRVHADERFRAQERAVEVALSRVDKEFHEHLISAREEARSALAATEKAIDKAEDATQKAIDKAEQGTDKRFDALYEAIRKVEVRVSEIAAVTGG